MISAQRSALALFAVAAAVVAAPEAAAQKLDRKFHEDPANGYKFKAFEGFEGIPAQPGDEGSGLVTKLSKTPNDILVFAVYDQKSESGDEGRTTAGKKRADLADVLSRRLSGFEKVAGEPVVSEEEKVKDLMALHRVWDLGAFHVDAWTFTTNYADLSLVYIVSDKDFDDKWTSMIEKSARTFTLIERKVAEEFEAGTKLTYEQQLEVAQREAEKTPGWRALPTPSKKFIIVTSCEKENFIKEVIERLEGSRLIFEQDFPPPPSFDAVSIVRICGDEETFHKYGGTGGGVAGWFSPATTELVLYDAVATDRNGTYAVVVHESFHQYCHFLFDESEAHRWFDEGHGDYYGGLEFKGSRPKITSRMPPGLNRLDVIREMMRDRSYRPVIEHVNFGHAEWQSQGPTNVSCYGQSWALIFYLRQGAEGKVPRKVWKQEYADIIPNYVRTLNEGYQRAYEEIREMRREQARRNGEDPDAIDRRVGRFELFARFGEKRKAEIWKAAMDASWGQVDMEEFERNWVEYCEDVLK